MITFNIFSTTHVEIFGYGISNAGCKKDVANALSFMSEKTSTRYMACANPHSLVIAEKDPFFKKALLNADILLPDGSGIILAAKALKIPLSEKVAGTDFFLEMNRMAQEHGGIRYFFLGATDDVLNLIRIRLEHEYPHIEFTGSYSPPFRKDFSEEENELMLSCIRKARPDVLWVGLSAPKQEKWIYQNLNKLEVSFCGAIGAVFDYYAGTKKRSSDFWINLGLEWLPRFLAEPKRLWDRNLKSTPIFLSWILKEKIKQILILKHYNP
jgi:N-acetylglucosaminyldiphosphoundecaprenol N-acetyl-beta-D-mannosaminyltransferase